MIMSKGGDLDGQEAGWAAACGGRGREDLEKLEHEVIWTLALQGDVQGVCLQRPGGFGIALAFAVTPLRHTALRWGPAALHQ